jgi:hypothetical protein
MKSIITQVIANPRSKTNWIFYPNGMKPFVIAKSKCKGARIKAKTFCVCDFKSTTSAKGTIYVYEVHNYGELMLGKPTSSKKKGK